MPEKAELVVVPIIEEAESFWVVPVAPPFNGWSFLNMIDLLSKVRRW
jgi:hypothetical protein